MGSILILGGYGNFGKRIATALVKKNIPVIIAGRDKQKAEAFASTLSVPTETAIFNANQTLGEELQRLTPRVVINTCGPFQTSNYHIAQQCIKHGVHYIDLADGREFVTGITALDAEAKQHHVAVVSGASTVPGLSSAVIEHFLPEFSAIDSLTYGISPGQKAERGLATTKGILTYVGKPLKPFAGAEKPAYGWQNIYRQKFPDIGKRWMANCDIPDLDLLPARYGINSIRFSAGLELGILHLGLWALSWMVRYGLPLNLPRYAKPLLKASNAFDHFGSADGGMYVVLEGKDKAGKPHKRQWFIIAKNGDGPQIPTIPAIVLAEKLVSNQWVYHGATACVGLVTLEEYIKALSGFAVRVYTF